MTKRELARGSRWNQWDLHVHTPASFHWNGKKFEGDLSSDDNKKLVDEMINAMNNAEPAVFAIMDYWTFDGWFALKQRLTESDAPTLNKKVFPGIELRLSAPTNKRLNAHVIFSDEIQDQHLRDFLGNLKIDRIDRSVSRDAFVDLARATAPDMLEKKCHKKEIVDTDYADALLAGYKLAEIKTDSYKNAISNVPNALAIGFMPFDTNDGLIEIKWEEHYSYFLSLFESSPIFESRNLELRSAFLCEKTEKNGNWLESFKHGLKGVPRLVVAGSDAHCFVGTPGNDDKRGYTIVPLRAAKARTLVEQSIGRGLRLPYGKRTGVEVVDRLNIVAHDKFQEIIDDCNLSDSPIRIKELILDAPTVDDSKISVQIESSMNVLFGIAQHSSISSLTSKGEYKASEPTTPFFVSESEQQVVREMVEVVRLLETRRQFVPTSQALLNDDVQKEIIAQVQERIRPAQAALALDDTPIDVAAIVEKATQILVQKTIDIPRITVVPTGEVTTGFNPFSLDISFLNLQPPEREIVIHNLHTNEQETMASEVGVRENNLEDYIVHSLVDYDDVDYFTHAELLYDLAAQAVTQLRNQQHSEDELHNIMDAHRGLIARNIHSQMMEHFWEKAAGYEAQVSRGFTALKPPSVAISANQPIRYYRETVAEVSKIKQMLFGGFTRCLYQYQKFDSDTERRFAVILERDAIKWLKPAKGQFQIYYKLGSEQPEYIPDFVVETDDLILLVETKARDDVATPEVQSKASAAATWCGHASTYAKSEGSKAWVYLLVPHDEINESKRLQDFLRFQMRLS